MNFLTLKAAVLARISMGSSDPIASSVDDIVNEALHMVETANPGGWPWLQTRSTVTVTTSTFAFASLNADLLRINDVQATVNSVPVILQQLGPNEATQSYLSVTGAPEAWSVEGMSLRLWPAPSSSYSVTISGVVAEPDLSDAGDEPLMPASYHGSIIAAALVIYYETLQDATRAQTAAARFDGWVTRMMSHARSTALPPRVQLRSM